MRRLVAATITTGLVIAVGCGIPQREVKVTTVPTLLDNGAEDGMTWSRIPPSCGERMSFAVVPTD